MRTLYRHGVRIERPAGAYAGGVQDMATGRFTPVAADALVLYDGPASWQDGQVMRATPQAGVRELVGDGRLFLPRSAAARDALAMVQPQDVAVVTGRDGRTFRARITVTRELDRSLVVRRDL